MQTEENKYREAFEYNRKVSKELEAYNRSVKGLHTPQNEEERKKILLKVADSRLKLKELREAYMACTAYIERK